MTILPLRVIALFFSLLPPASAMSQNLSGISACVDPGHGPGSPNAGPTGLREANINFQVALFLKEYLKAAQIDTVLLTHMNNTTNISLSAREQIANDFGVTWFHSIHHNATGWSSNNSVRYTLLLLEERRSLAALCPDGRAAGTGQPEWSGQADVMSNIMAKQIWQGYRTTSYTTRLDWTFYGGCNGGFNLGVLNDLQMPGELSEATFHDHPGEEAKMRNSDFLRVEARALAMSFFDYYNAGSMPTGALIGIVGDGETGKPVNGARVTINPGNHTYTTDHWNNGIYVFDSLEANDYTVTVELAGYESFSQTVPVGAHAFNYCDARLIPAGAPTVTNVTPYQDSTGVYVYDPIRFSFSRSMETSSVQWALHLTPVCNGKLQWDTSKRNFAFTPEFRFDFDSRYTVTIDGSARDSFGHPLDGNGDGLGGDAFSWNFTTIPLTIAIPVVVGYTPAKAQTGVFPREVVEVWFNRPIDLASFQQNVSVVAAGNRRALTRTYPSFENAHQKFSIVPIEILRSSTLHTVTLSKNIRDLEGTAMLGAVHWSFTTGASAERWETKSTFSPSDQPFSDPLQHAYTAGIVPDSTQYLFDRTLAISDSTTGHLRYHFSGSDGRIFFDLLDPMQLDSTDIAALFVHGDGSGNVLQWHLRGEDGSEYVYARNLDWNGWRCVRLEVRSDSVREAGQIYAAAALAPLRWEMLLLSQTAATHGEIFFEDLLHVHPQPTAVATAPSAPPQGFWLAPSFPNPFNPETAIRFFAPRPALVRMVIVDALGRVVRVLADGVFAAGEHRMLWDGRDDRGTLAASGIYFAQMSSGNFSATHKLLLLR